MSDEKDVHNNLDPLSGEKGAHPLGTGIGAALGGAAGLAGTVAAATVLGPAGVVVGAAVGALAGGWVGKGAAEAVNPTEDDTALRQELSRQPWFEDGDSWADYEPACKVGAEGRSRFSSLRFEEVERDLEQDYMNGEGRFGIPWEKARHAARAAWDRAAAEHEAAGNTLDEAPAADGRFAVKSVLTPTGNAMPLEEPRQAATELNRTLDR